MTVITLLTDFGLHDGYPGVMKGVIWNIAPEVQIADISHSIKPQNIYQGALALSRTARFFPPGTIHVAVVDPGVGTHRRPIALHLGDHYFVGPDNGLFTLVLEKAELSANSIKIIQLDQPQYWLPEISRVFHGRDIFAPSAAHLALGVPIHKLGSPIIDPIRLNISHPIPIRNGGWRGQVVEVDTFGNLSTNIEDAHLVGMDRLRIRIAGHEINGLVNTFGDRPDGTLIALYGTSHDLMISIVKGDAAHTLNVSVGEVVEVLP
jgi:S-adenosyl-L-methionine hydrolase (adenosine-forming)